MAADGSAAKYIHVLCCLNTASMRCLPWFLDGFIKKIRPLTTRLQTRTPAESLALRYDLGCGRVGVTAAQTVSRALTLLSFFYVSMRFTVSTLHFTVFRHDLQFLLLIPLCFTTIYSFFSFRCVSARFTISAPQYTVFLLGLQFLLLSPLCFTTICSFFSFRCVSPRFTASSSHSVVFHHDLQLLLLIPLCFSALLLSSLPPKVVK